LALGKAITGCELRETELLGLKGQRSEQEQS
jgi:hypothetical protein